MKILITADVHANYAALLAVHWAEPADEIWCLGDLVAFGPQPAETIEWVRTCTHHCVRGNHDDALVYRNPTGAGILGELGDVTRRKHRELLSSEQINYLRDLARVIETTEGGCRFHLAHAVPGGEFNGPLIMPNIPESDLEKLIEHIQADVICCGHTHFPMVRRIGQKTFVNPGSVGLSLDGDRRASYAVWQDGDIVIRRTEYDIVATVARLTEAGLPSLVIARLSEVLRNGALILRQSDDKETER